jgi:hypothetical protein
MRILAALCCAALTCAACDIKVDEGGVRGVTIAENSAEDVWTRTYTLAEGASFEVTGRNGEIEVTGGAGPGVEVRAERRVRANDEQTARELLRTLEVREEVTSSGVKISTAGEESSWAPPGLGRRAQARVRYRIRVPASPALTMTFRTQNGGVRLTRVGGRITAATTNGGITGEDVSGALKAESVNGGIRLDMAAVSGDVAVSTTNGGVRLTMPAAAKVNLEASWVNGGIDVADEFGVPEVDDSARSLSAAVHGGGPTVSVTSVNGGIRIRARGATAD